MSLRYTAAWLQDGAFNPLTAPTPIVTYTYELWSWGGNASGELGLGDTTDRSSPNQIGALTDWLNVSLGRFHSVATKTDGTLWSWGKNQHGQLGTNNTTYRSSPVQVGALTSWLLVSAGGYSSYAVKTDGTLWSWGLNAQGQLGLGNQTNYSSPKQIGALTTWLNVISGYNWVIAWKHCRKIFTSANWRTNDMGSYWRW